MRQIPFPRDVRTMLQCLAGALSLLLTLLPTLSLLPEAEAIPPAAAETIALLPCSLGGDMQLDLLARVIAAEAGEMSYAEQVAYGAMLKNRTADPRFPRELGQVIGAAGLRLAEGTLPDRALRAARSALFGVDPTGGALYCFPAEDAAARVLFAGRITAEFDNLLFAA